MSRFIISGSEIMHRRYCEMSFGNTFPIYLRFRMTAQIPTLLSLKKLTNFGHLSNLYKKSLGSHHSEKTEFLGQIQKKPTFVIGNFNQLSHVKMGAQWLSGRVLD